ncbi:NAD(P)/FAD-dependent oxidoreductase [Flavilitoribacter nigricans]|uniref:Geranylgeranyl reductase n=1 Tax=Flavilitoribacter nigricans (strain ATCC 23147 / DSM 23189 / NBRC 102662 / NCIMB 1420 / SS-2) TaxID=1122177 RepID=A0A2D0N6M9_FLAN2|nr:geranylgeranyl reductase family protein [Flavilitoribacter nigricans]PHN04154.1 geranylgeranyl reductase [Flavilitoribacter nigricans DSM 23189 = NBRC 102662]
MIQTDIAILGAGPGGASTALKLSHLGLPCVLIDKADFPRDKVCGDAISGKVTTLLHRLDPAIMARFHGMSIQSDVWGMRFYAPNGKRVEVPFPIKSEAGHAPGYVSKRIDFDQFLIDEVRRRPDIQLHLNKEISSFKRQETGWRLQTADGDFTVNCRLLVVADGAHSRFSRTIAGLEKDTAHHAAALRAYYRNVGDLSERGFIELHFIHDITPGYFWIFPLPDGMANVGLGMRSDILAKKGLNLKETLRWIIEKHPTISERFKDAELIGKVHGFGLPLGSKPRPISGDHYVLVGDAGHLVDPITGEGIGNACYSGFIAAELAEKCVQENDFSAARLQAYDIRVARVLGSEMALSYRLQKLLAYPRVVNFMARVVAGNQRMMQVLSRMYADFDLRLELARPWFWIKMFFTGKR